MKTACLTVFEYSIPFVLGMFRENSLLNIQYVNFLMQILARWIGEGETIWLVLLEKNSFFWSTGSGGGGVDGLGVSDEVLKQPCAVSLGPPHSVHRSCTHHVGVRYSPDGG